MRLQKLLPVFLLALLVQVSLSAGPFGSTGSKLAERQAGPFTSLRVDGSSDSQSFRSFRARSVSTDGINDDLKRRGSGASKIFQRPTSRKDWTTVFHGLPSPLHPEAEKEFDNAHSRIRSQEAAAVERVVAHGVSAESRNIMKQTSKSLMISAKADRKRVAQIHRKGTAAQDGWEKSALKIPSTESKREAHRTARIAEANETERKGQSMALVRLNLETYPEDHL